MEGLWKNAIAAQSGTKLSVVFAEKLHTNIMLVRKEFITW